MYAAAREPATAGLAAGLGAVGAAFLAFALVRRNVELLPWPLVCVGAAYAASLFAHGASVDGRAPLVAAALLLCAELAAWSLDERHAIAAERRVVAARAGAVAVLVLAGLGAATAVVALAAAPGGGGLGWTALGAVSAVAVVGLASRFLTR